MMFCHVSEGRVCFHLVLFVTLCLWCESVSSQSAPSPSPSPLPYTDASPIRLSDCLNGVDYLVSNERTGDLFAACASNSAALAAGSAGVVLKIPSANFSATVLLGVCANPQGLILSAGGDLYAICTPNVVVNNTSVIYKWTGASGVATPLYEAECHCHGVGLNVIDEIYLSCDEGFFYSTNGGAGVLVQLTFAENCVGPVVINQQNRDVFFVCSNNSSIYRSIAGTAQFQSFTSSTNVPCAQVNNVALDKIGNLYAGCVNQSGIIVYQYYLNSTYSSQPFVLTDASISCPLPSNFWWNNAGGLFVSCKNDDTIKLWTVDALSISKSGPEILGNCVSESLTGSVNSYEMYCGNTKGEIVVFTSKTFDNPHTCPPSQFNNFTQKCESSPTPNPSDPSPMVLSSGAIAGIIIGALAALLFLAILWQRVRLQIVRKTTEKRSAAIDLNSQEYHTIRDLPKNSDENDKKIANQIEEEEYDDI